MTEDLRISMIQSHIIWEDREENLGYYGELLRRVSGRTDLAVLPETFTTGFSMDVEKYDLLIYVANWPEARKKAWKALLHARAIENMAYVCGVNRVGVDGKGFLFRGDSMIYNAKGKKLADAGKREEITRTCTLKKSELDEFRAKVPAWKDADGFSIDF